VDVQRGVYPITLPSTPGGSTAPIIASPCRLCGWSVKSDNTPAVVQAFDVAVAAAAAGTLTLTLAAYVSWVTVTPAAAWPAGVNQVTLTNVQGGTQTVDIEGGTANPATMLFSPPLGTTGTPVVSVPAIVGGPAYTIEAEAVVFGAGLTAGPAVAQILDGGQVAGVFAAVTGDSITRWLSEGGVEIGTGISVKVLAGQVSGCVYVRDVDPTFENA
jgi:hypothetical protein